MRKTIILILCLALCGCASANARKLNMLRKDSRQVDSLSATFSRSKKDVFTAVIAAIQKQPDIKITYSDMGAGEIHAQTGLWGAVGSGLFFGPGGVSGANVGVFLAGDNPTDMRIAQLNYGGNKKEYIAPILAEIMSLL